MLETLSSIGLGLLALLCAYATVSRNFSMVDPCRIVGLPDLGGKLSPADCYDILNSAIEEADNSRSAAELIFKFTLGARVEAVTYASIGIAALCAWLFKGFLYRVCVGGGGVIGEISLESARNSLQLYRRADLPESPGTTLAPLLTLNLLFHDGNDKCE